jgi:hypothetical protein
MALAGFSGAPTGAPTDQECVGISPWRPMHREFERAARLSARVLQVCNEPSCTEDIARNIPTLFGISNSEWSSDREILALAMQVAGS